MKTISWVVSVFLLATWPSDSWAQRFALTAGDYGWVSVERGEALVVSSPVYAEDWDVTHPGTKERGTTTLNPCLGATDPAFGKMLGWDPAGKSKAVTMRPTAMGARGPQWLIEKAGRRDYTLRAAEGPFKGWYLGAEAEGKERKYKDGMRYLVRGLILEQEPKKPLLFRLEDVGR